MGGTQEDFDTAIPRSSSETNRQLTLRIAIFSYCTCSVSFCFWASNCYSLLLITYNYALRLRVNRFRIFLLLCVLIFQAVDTQT